MPSLSKISGPKTIHDASIASLSIFELLAPAASTTRSCARRSQVAQRNQRWTSSCSNHVIESFFYATLSQASLCQSHRSCSTHDGLPNRKPASSTVDSPRRFRNRHKSSGKTNVDGYDTKWTSNGMNALGSEYERDTLNLLSIQSPVINESCGNSSSALEDFAAPKVNGCSGQTRWRDSSLGGLKEPFNSTNGSSTRSRPRHTDGTIAQTDSRTKEFSLGQEAITMRLLPNKKFSGNLANAKPHKIRAPPARAAGCSASIDHPIIKYRNSARKQTVQSVSAIRQEYHTRPADTESTQQLFAKESHLPTDFFNDISLLKDLSRTSATERSQDSDSNMKHSIVRRVSSSERISTHDKRIRHDKTQLSKGTGERLKLLSSVRELETKLEKARKELANSLSINTVDQLPSTKIDTPQIPVVLTKEDYINLVDLYYYSHNSRFSPESTDASPTPLVLDDYSFTLSSDFSPGSGDRELVNEDEAYESPLKKVEEMLRQRQLREVAVMQVFVDLLLDDHSSNRALYEAYKQFPDPGVSYLPKGIVRLFLQRMSTPWTLSEKSMLRYLSLIDDMQRADIPITTSEWSSAIYLAGRSFRKVTNEEVNNSLHIWRTMEQEAGVEASHVTFNILFDIAVRSGRFALCETILKEMHSRNLRLNRLGRVGLMYYHGFRQDGDGVRKAYRDFVEAGEIVDTLVLNCVISSLMNAREPQAAEQIYARMKNLQSQLHKAGNGTSGDISFKQYPEPGGNMIDLEMASNHLGRVLENAPRWKSMLPEHHKALQARMPLTPDHVTFRSMIAYHATISGDIDRITVLLQDMTDVFQLPLQTITFQLMFKGFAIHGPAGGPHSGWSVQRLNLCWKACRAAIIDSMTPNLTFEKVSSSETVQGEVPSPEPTLPSITQINASPPHAPLENENPPLSRPPPRRLSDWAEFVLDLAAFPRERLKRLERFHATMFDAEDGIEPKERRGIHTFQSPYFQSSAYTAPEPNLDGEEGEYELPTPSGSGLLVARDDLDDKESDADMLEKRPPNSILGSESQHKVYATRALICWLLRAYARNTRSRNKVEEIWGSLRKVYKPRDATERESVVRVLRRCLRDCDREGSS